MMQQLESAPATLRRDEASGSRKVGNGLEVIVKFLFEETIKQPFERPFILRIIKI